MAGADVDSAAATIKRQSTTTNSGDSDSNTNNTVRAAALAKITWARLSVKHLKTSTIKTNGDDGRDDDDDNAQN